MHEAAIRSEPARARRTLSTGVLVFRLAALAWMIVLNVTAGQPFRRPASAWAGIAVAAAWTVWLAVSPDVRDGPAVLWVDLAISAGLITLSGVVVAPGTVIGPRLFYATAYPISTSLAWGAAWGPYASLAATAVMSLALFASRLANGIPVSDIGGGAASLLNGIFNFLMGGVAAGVVSRLLDRWTRENASLVNATIRARERAARLGERQSMNRDIHDSVLQGLAFAIRTGKDLAGRGTVPADEMGGLAAMVEEQERHLRKLVSSEPEEQPHGTASLRDALESTGKTVGMGDGDGVGGLPVTVRAVGPIWLPTAVVGEVSAAVRQALDNVVEHAEATAAGVFAIVDDDWVVVSVRDNGRGFVYDEHDLEKGGKLGILKSMGERARGLGGKMRVDTAPGVGTEVEFRIPAPPLPDGASPGDER